METETETQSPGCYVVRDGNITAETVAHTRDAALERFYDYFAQKPCLMPDAFNRRRQGILCLDTFIDEVPEGQGRNPALRELYGDVLMTRFAQDLGSIAAPAQIDVSPAQQKFPF